MIKENFLKENKGKFIRIIFANGFQLRGKLINYDQSDMLIETTTYDSDPIVVSYSAVSAIVPNSHK